MNTSLNISEDDSEVELEHCISSKTSVKLSPKYFVQLRKNSVPIPVGLITSAKILKFAIFLNFDVNKSSCDFRSLCFEIQKQQTLIFLLKLLRNSALWVSATHAIHHIIYSCESQLCPESHAFSYNTQVSFRSKSWHA